MRILHITPWYKPAYVYGGPIESVSKLCESLAEAGHEIDVFTTTANGKEDLDVPIGNAVELNGVSVYYFQRITKDPTQVSPALWSKLKKVHQNYDLVHIHSWWNPLAIISSYICNRNNVKVILSPRGMLSDYIFNSGNSFIKKAIHRTFGKKLLSTTIFHATSMAEYTECVNLINGWHGFVVPNILSLPFEINLRRKGNIFTLLYMSRIHPKKGLELLFKAVSKLEMNFVLKIAGLGDNNYIKELKDLAYKLGISSKIEWLGWKDRSQKFAIISNADLLVLTSANENFANIVVEALHMGTPVLLSEGVALSSYILEYNLGWVTSLDVHDVKIKIEEAYFDVEKRIQVNLNGRKIIDNSFSREKLVNDYISNYQNIIDNKQP